MNRLHAAVTEMNHSYSPICAPYFLELVSKQWPALYTVTQQYCSYSGIVVGAVSFIAMAVDFFPPS